ncbi:HAD family hydrolase [Colwelliaceae bacterium BS250]
MLTNNLLGVIFDLDNTLVSSSLDFNKIKDSLGCPKEKDILDYVDSLPKEHQIQARLQLFDYEMADAHDARKLAGTDELLALLSSLGIPCAINTRNCQQAALLKLQNNGIEIPLLLTREEHKAKPAPDSVLYVAKYWQQNTNNLLFVGDHLYDLQTAQNANTMSCLLTYGRTLGYASLANLVVKDLTELSGIIAHTFNVQAINETH